MRETAGKEIVLQEDLCRTFKEKGGKSGLDLLEKNTWIHLDKQQKADLWTSLGDVQDCGVLYVTPASPISLDHHILKYGPARKVMERGQHTEKVEDSWGKADVVVNNGKGNNRAAEIHKPANQHLFRKAKSS